VLDTGNFKYSLSFLRFLMPARLANTRAATVLPPPSRRILDAARVHLFTYGYSALTMDNLAAELGMSKKTLYVHFPSKDALVEALIVGFTGEIRASADALFGDKTLSFTRSEEHTSELQSRQY